MDIFDLVQAIKEFYNGDIKATLEAIDDLILEITDNPDKLTVELSKQSEELIKDNNLCPMCYGDIVEKESSTESYGEYFGRPVYQKEKVYGCESCNYIEGQK